jgi:hypothetical protein
MARNNPRKQQDASTPGYGPGEVPPMVGGTPGVVIPEGDKRLSPTAVVSNGIMGSAKRDQPVQEAPEPRTYVVVTGPGAGSQNGIMVLYNKVKTRLQQGKVVSEASVDIQALIAQGVVLREIPRAVPETTPEETPPEDQGGEELGATGTED